MWLDFTLVAGVAIAAAVWLGMSTYILVVQRRRDLTRDTLARARTALAPMSGVTPEERLATAQALLARASRELVMHAAAEHDLAAHVFEALAALLAQRWSSARL